jgi:hypothetical protein
LSPPRLPVPPSRHTRQGHGARAPLLDYIHKVIEVNALILQTRHCEADESAEAISDDVIVPLPSFEAGESRTSATILMSNV